MIPAWTLAMMDSAQSAWSPLDLGASLLAWWAPPHAGNTTLASGAISSWRDEVAAHDLAQASSGSRPAYSATAFGGLACAVFDGTNDYLSLAPVPASFPTSGAGEIWVSCSQDALVADITQRMAFAFGAASGADQRNVLRAVVSAVNRAQLIADGQVASNASVDFSGVHVVRGRYGTAMQPDVDGLAGSSVAITPTTTTVRVRMGADQMNTPGRFWKGAVRQVLVTDVLTTGQATALLDYLNTGL